MELIYQHPLRVTGPDGTGYVVAVWAEPEGEMWSGWLEFEPIDGSGGSLQTDRETAQSSRVAMVRWAEALNPLFLDGAFERAARRTPRERAVRLVARLETTLPPEGARYSVRIFAEEERAGTWLGTIEFEPLQGGPVVRARRETSQPSEALVEYWAGGLEPVYLEGALKRAEAAAARRRSV
jgi:hypothetical protein